MANLAFGEAPPIRVTGLEAPTRTLDDVAVEADKIFKEVKDSGATTPKDLDTLFHKKQEEYKDFSTSFPIPFRCIVQLRQYHPAAFRKFLAYYKRQAAAAAPGQLSVFPTRERFIEVQAEYVVFLYIEQTERCSPQAVNRYRDGVRKQLLEEDADFVKTFKEVDAEKEDIAKEAARLRREALLEHVLALKLQKGRVAGESEISLVPRATPADQKS
jgi:hypothetical protein